MPRLLYQWLLYQLSLTPLKPELSLNTKVRLLMKQSYGLRDFKYLKLKIMDLPSRKIRVSI